MEGSRSAAVGTDCMGALTDGEGGYLETTEQQLKS